jgi:MoaA/NifB/PqqE/SkfB family radical SAM enzyme
MVVGRRCSLRCKHCSNLIPYSPPDTLEYDINSIISDLTKVLSIADIDVLQVQGGEPFLYPHLSQLLNFALGAKQISKIHIATNGTMLPNVEIQLLANPKVEVRISQYPHTADLSTKLKTHLDKNNIKNWIYLFKSGTGKWNDLGSVDAQPITTDEAELDKIFDSCLKNKCLTLENGTIGYCSRSILAPKIQNFQPESGDYVNVRTEDFQQQLHNYINNPHHMEACKYCNGGYSNEIFVTAGEQISD